MSKNIVIIGASGVVGQEMMKCLENESSFDGSLRLVASARSAGQVVNTSKGSYTIEELSEKVFVGMDIALFAAGGDISKEWAPVAVKNGCLVIDNSSYFRYEESVPLVVPEINGVVAKNNQGIIANPNCTTAIAALPLWVIEQNFGLKKVIMSTYQAVSGAGKEGMDELLKQVDQYNNGDTLEVNKFSRQILFNLIPQIDVFLDNNYTKEEMKVVWELRKIFSKPDLAVSCTAVRIPVIRAHSESIVIETEKKIDPAEVRKLFAETPGIQVVDDPTNLQYPTPLTATNKYAVEVGRIRQNIIFGEYGLEFFVAGDQLLRGAAYNAVKIANLFINK